MIAQRLGADERSGYRQLYSQVHEGDQNLVVDRFAIGIGFAYPGTNDANTGIGWACCAAIRICQAVVTVPAGAAGHGSGRDGFVSRRAVLFQVQVIDADVLVSDRRTERKFSWGISKNRVLLRTIQFAGVAPVDIGGGSRCAPSDLGKCVVHVHYPGDLDGAEYDREKQKRNQRKFNCCHAALCGPPPGPNGWSPHLSPLHSPLP